MAVAIEDYNSPKKLKDDPRYVKWMFRLYGKRNGEGFQRMIPHHKCTDEDYDQFFPV